MARIETGKMLPMETIMKGLEMTLPPAPPKGGEYIAMSDER